MPAAVSNSPIMAHNDPAVNAMPPPTLVVLYHFGISTLDTDFPAVFGDVKFVCTGGSAGRMAKYALQFSALSGLAASENLSKTDRYAMYKTGPVLWVNHGMGVPSLSIMLIELFKLLRLAGATNVEIVRIGTSGGVGVAPGTVIVSNGALNGALEQKHVQWIDGKQVKRDAILHERLGNDLFETAKGLNVPVERGLTFCADDFYEGQMRLDGFFCDYNQSAKHGFLTGLSQMGVKNIEMESVGFAAFTHRAQIPAAICCVVLVNRMSSDGIQMQKSQYADFEERPFQIVAHYMLGRIHATTAAMGNGTVNGQAKQNGMANGQVPTIG